MERGSQCSEQEEQVTGNTCEGIMSQMVLEIWTHQRLNTFSCIWISLPVQIEKKIDIQYNK